ncbi:uncharacterized protein clcf1 [Thunnus thynnus]|uniref:uncharacterized protein clcf1 n=1 Tax=Thunnus thynnus TaxID=8237 RepID=UPI0035277D4C
MKRLCGVHQNHLVLLLAAAMATALDPSHNLASERSSIESTYELTKYLEYQLKEIKDVYLTYLGPPFNEKDFSPPRPNSTALTLPSAATRLELWHGLENQARLAQNQKAYSVLLAAVRELARSTLCPSLKTSLLHFCTGLDGLLGSISALMTTLGYALPPSSSDIGSDVNTGGLQYLQRGTGGDRPAPLMSQSLYRSRAGTRTESGQRNNQRHSGTRMVRGEREDGLTVDVMEKKRGKEGRRAEATAAGGRSGRSREKGRGERGRRGRREEPESWKWALSEEGRAGEEEEEELEWEGGTETSGRRRRLLSINEDGEEGERQPEPTVSVSYPGTESTSSLLQPIIQTNNNNNNNQYSYNLNLHHPDTLRKEDGVYVERGRGFLLEEERQIDMEGTSSSSSTSFSTVHHQRRPPRSLFSPTLQPPLSTLSLLYQFGAGEEHTLLPQPVPLSLQRGTSLLSPPLTPLLSSTSSSAASSSLLSVRPTMNDFARKVEGFWILRELQSWLWRSAKDFNRLKKRLRG